MTDHQCFLRSCYYIVCCALDLMLKFIYPILLHFLADKGNTFIQTQSFTPSKQLRGAGTLELKETNSNKTPNNQNALSQNSY
ncbi:hypothetical protein HanRHA438_Chr09g0425761 [Helianthus annuus]|nr:hypothetical protein HanLR1_Chr09g0339871 [Helianthus annuus]KAJ0890613.1 hypothetical protein HanRHA438_Chr09g0425761 [Helianthus annuus]